MELSERSYAMLDELDVGLLVYDLDADAVVGGNQRGRRFVAAFKGEVDVVRRVFAAYSAGARPAALEMVSRQGARFVVRLKHERGDRNERWAVILSLEVPRLVDLLHERYGLSRRACQLVELVQAGLPNGEIAARTQLTVGTVKQYLHRIYAAVEVSSRSELISRMSELGRFSVAG